MKYGFIIQNPASVKNADERIAVLSGHLTPTNIKHIKAILKAGLKEGRINRIDYFITHKGFGTYEVKIVSGVGREQRQGTATFTTDTPDKWKSKNPIKFWIMDSKTSAKKGKDFLSERAANTECNKLNKVAGFEKFQVVGFGVENPKNEIKFKIASSPSLSMLTEALNKHFYSTNFKIEDGKVYNAKGLTDIKIKKTGKRYLAYWPK